MMRSLKKRYPNLLLAMVLMFISGGVALPAAAGFSFCPPEYGTYGRMALWVSGVTIAWGIVMFFIMQRRFRISSMPDRIVGGLFYGATAGLITFISISAAIQYHAQFIVDQDRYYEYFNGSTIIDGFFISVLLSSYLSLWILFAVLALPRSYANLKSLRIMYLLGWLPLNTVVFLTFVAIVYANHVFAQVSIDFPISEGGGCSFSEPITGWITIAFLTLALIIDGVLLRRYLSRSSRTNISPLTTNEINK